jgi:glycine betaine/proline transport system permease protein
VTALAVAARRPFRPRLTKSRYALVLLLAFAVLFVLLRGSMTLPLDSQASLFTTLTDFKNWMLANQKSWFFALFFTPIRTGTAGLVGFVTGWLTTVGWVGITAVAGALGFTFVTWRTGLAVAAAMLGIGLLGMWDATMTTLGQMLVAVALSLLIGIPIGILAGRSDRVLRAVTPVLDLMQIMPTYAYLVPLTIVFFIGNGTATIATMIYAIPPAIRLTALGIRGVSSETVEAATSLGSTGSQVLRKVQMPMARTTIGLAVNQTIMMALSMVVITAFVAAGGLGEKLLKALEIQDVGGAFDAGLAVVLLAMVLDRLTASASHVSDRRHTGAEKVTKAAHRRMAAIGGAIAVVGVALGVTQPWAHAFPKTWSFSFADPVNAFVDWLTTNLSWLTVGVKDATSAWIIGPLQDVLTQAPFWLVIAFTAGLALLITGRRAAIVVTLAGLLIVALQVWEPAMETLTQVLFGVAITMVIGVAVGTWAARSYLVSQVVRPVNDALQTMPAFVYLIPALALFGPTRFTAVIASVLYSIPAVIRLVEDGVRGVPAASIEAAESAGSTAVQVITKVQLPMARRSLLAAVNQGVVLVLAMVVVGGLVGGQALGYHVVQGLVQGPDFGIGLASALAIVLLGVTLDRITQGAGARREVRRVDEE